jgi:modulator of FtsH protease
MQILVIGICGLIPGLGVPALGGLVLLLGTVVFIQHLMATRLTLQNRAEWRRSHTAVVIFVLLGQVQEIPVIVAGIQLTAGHATGLYWLAGGVISIFVLSVLNAWVLLIEILR